jgi:O-antigen/teichoic acid export membrane protein
LIKKISNLLYKSEFGKNILTLGSGTVLAQIIPFLFYPIIARIFTPAEVGLLATITAIFVLLSNFATGRYELGILVTKTKEDAAHLAILAIALSFVVIIFIYIVLQLFFVDMLSERLHEPQLHKWLFICPVAALALIIYNTYNEWCVRNGYFKRLSVNKITNSTAITAGKLLLGVVKIFSQGLVVGDLLGRIFSAGACIFKALQKDAAAFKEISVKRIKQLAREFAEFPKFIMPGRLLNEIGKQLPVFFLGFYFSSVEVGYFSMSVLVLYAPISMIAFAIRDVVRQRANEDYKNSGSCRIFYNKIFKILSVIAIFGSIVLILCLPFIFSIFVGKQWDTAAYYAQILTIPTLLSFVSIPLFDVLIITNKLKINFLWQIYYVVIIFLSLWIGCTFYDNIVTALYLFAGARSSAYLLSILLSWYYSKGKLLKTQIQHS